MIVKKLIMLLIVLFLGCAPNGRHHTVTLKLKGSDTMLPLARFWAEVYMIENPAISVYVEGGGTATGMAALARGDIDICLASRTITSEEAQALIQQYGTVGVSILVAKDALSVYVHPDNPVKNLTISQLEQIYLGTVTNWRQVGGDNADILILNRMPTSGTYAYFQEHVLGGRPYTTSARALPTTSAIIETVAGNKYAIGYGGIAYETDVHHCDINGVSPLIENVMNDSYPLTRYLYLYTIDTPQGKSKEFINWVLGERGQDVVKWVGYFPIWHDQ